MRKSRCGKPRVEGNVCISSKLHCWILLASSYLFHLFVIVVGKRVSNFWCWGACHCCCMLSFPYFNIWRFAFERSEFLFLHSESGLKVMAKVFIWKMLIKPTKPFEIWVMNRFCYPGNLIIDCHLKFISIVLKLGFHPY